MATFCILHSNSIDRFDIGSCLSIEKRLIEHQTDEFSTGFTHRAQDWKVFFEIDNIEYNQALIIVKLMKAQLDIKFYYGKIIDS